MSQQPPPPGGLNPVGYPPPTNQGPVYTSQPMGQPYQQQPGQYYPQQPGMPVQPGMGPDGYNQDPNKRRRSSSSGGGCLEMCCCCLAGYCACQALSDLLCCICELFGDN